MTNTSYTETELVHLFSLRDERAFNYIYDNYSAVLYGVIQRSIADEGVAAEVLSEVFVKIWKSSDQYNPSKGRLYTWMINIARNATIDKLRSKSFRNNRHVQLVDSFENNTIGEQSTSLNLDHVGLGKVLQNLKKEHLILIDLAYFKGYTQEEISQELEMPLGTVKTRIRKALTHLRALFSKE